MKKIAVRHVQFERADSDAQRTTRGIDKLALDVCKCRRVDRLRRWLVFELRDRRGRQRNPAALIDLNQLAAFPWHLRRSFASGVRELDRDRHRRRVRARDGETFAQCLLARVVVKTEAAEGNATDRRYGSGFNGEHACGRLQQLSPMNGVPVSSPAI